MKWLISLTLLCMYLISFVGHVHALSLGNGFSPVISVTQEDDSEELPDEEVDEEILDETDEEFDEEVYEEELSSDDEDFYEDEADTPRPSNPRSTPRVEPVISSVFDEEYEYFAVVDYTDYQEVIAGDITARTSIPVSIEKRSSRAPVLVATFSNGTRIDLNALPDQAYNALEGRYVPRCRLNCGIILTEQLLDGNSRFIYEIDAVRLYPVFGLFSFKVNTPAQVDASNGALL